MHPSDALILNSLNLSKFNLTLDEKTECLEIFKDWGRHKALDHAHRLHESKLYNGKIDTINADPHFFQTQVHAAYMETHKIVRAYMEKTGNLHLHLQCPKTNYFTHVEVSRRGNSKVKGTFKKYDFEKKEPFLKVLLQAPLAK